MSLLTSTEGLHASPPPRAVTRNGIVARVLLCTAGVFVAFLVVNEAYRRLETRLAVAILDWFEPGRAVLNTDTSVVVIPKYEPAFVANVAPSCSALSSLLVVAALATLVPTSTPRRLRALTVALVVIAVGNLLRITASLAVGLWLGEESEVLFHDWAGSVFTFAYTFFGYALMLYLMLPKRVPDERGTDPDESGIESEGAVLERA